jgi:hypothetical protein
MIKHIGRSKYTYIPSYANLYQVYTIMLLNLLTQDRTIKPTGSYVSDSFTLYIMFLWYYLSFFSFFFYNIIYKAG